MHHIRTSLNECDVPSHRCNYYCYHSRIPSLFCFLTDRMSLKRSEWWTQPKKKMRTSGQIIPRETERLKTLDFIRLYQCLMHKLSIIKWRQKKGKKFLVWLEFSSLWNNCYYCSRFIYLWCVLISAKMKGIFYISFFMYYLKAFARNTGHEFNRCTFCMLSRSGLSRITIIGTVCKLDNFNFIDKF